MNPILAVIYAIRGVSHAQKGLRAMESAFHVVSFLAQLASFVPKIANSVAEALRDGDISPDEAEEFAMDLSRAKDIRVKVHGHDVLDDEAQEHLARCVGRIVANAVAAGK